MRRIRKELYGSVSLMEVRAADGRSCDAGLIQSRSSDELMPEKWLRIVGFEVH